MTNSMHHKTYSPGRDRDPFVKTCPSWCVAAHGFEGAAEDRHHYGEDLHVALELEPAEPVPGGAHMLSELDLYLQQHYRETEATVHLGINELRGWTLTIEETRTLRDRLTSLLDAHGTTTEPTTAPVSSQGHNHTRGNEQ